MIYITRIFEGSFHSAPSEQMVMTNRIPRTSTYEYGKLGGLNPNLAIQSSYAACSRPSSTRQLPHLLLAAPPDDASAVRCCVGVALVMSTLNFCTCRA